MTLDLMGALRDFFVAEFAKGNPAATSAAGFVLSFEQFPITLSPEECLLDPQDPASFVTARQQEMITRLVVDHATLPSGGYRVWTSEWVSDTYQHEVLGPARYLAEPAGDASDEDGGQFAGLRKKAKDEFRTAVSVMGQPDDFAPTDALPSNWLDMRQDDNWLVYRLSASATPPAASSAPTQRFTWRAVDAGLLATAVQVLNGTVEPEAAAPPPKAKPKRFGHLHAAADVVAIRGDAPKHADEPARAASFDRARLVPLQRLQAFGKSSESKQGAQVAEMLLTPPAKRKLHFNRQMLGARADLAGVLSQAVVETPPAPVNDRMEVSFSYQVVRVARPWLFFPFLRHPNWYLPGMRAGALSNPSTPDAPGRIGLLPTALLVIRDLSITADWKESDMAELEKSFAIGPFGKGTQARIMGQVLKCDGVQIIGCVNERLPMLPPRSDPALEPSP